MSPAMTWTERRRPAMVIGDVRDARPPAVRSPSAWTRREPAVLVLRWFATSGRWFPGTGLRWGSPPAAIASATPTQCSDTLLSACRTSDRATSGLTKDRRCQSRTRPRSISSSTRPLATPGALMSASSLEEAAFFTSARRSESGVESRPCGTSMTFADRDRYREQLEFKRVRRRPGLRSLLDARPRRRGPLTPPRPWFQRNPRAKLGIGAKDPWVPAETPSVGLNSASHRLHDRRRP
jgi:hypothetical protein